MDIDIINDLKLIYKSTPYEIISTLISTLFIIIVSVFTDISHGFKIILVIFFFFLLITFPIYYVVLKYLFKMRKLSKMKTDLKLPLMRYNHPMAFPTPSCFGPMHTNIDIDDKKFDEFLLDDNYRKLLIMQLIEKISKSKPVFDFKEDIYKLIILRDESYMFNGNQTYDDILASELRRQLQIKNNNFMNISDSLKFSFKFERGDKVLLFSFSSKNINEIYNIANIIKNQYNSIVLIVTVCGPDERTMKEIGNRDHIILFPLHEQSLNALPYYSCIQ